jgi:phenylpyruvate tautomerase PptA (4-oxalocrotonate tautomerase family)
MNRLKAEAINKKTTVKDIDKLFADILNDNHTDTKIVISEKDTEFNKLYNGLKKLKTNQL